MDRVLEEKTISKIVWAIATDAIVVLVVAALGYTLNNLMSPLASSNTFPSTSNQLITPIDQADFNWAGYCVATDFSNPQPVVTVVCGSWVVPQVQISQNDTFSAAWIGIGGFFDNTLIQTGTEQDCINGTLYYDAWYELLPNDAIIIPTIDVSPGDTMRACIGLVNPVENLWSIYIADVSTGQSVNQTVVYDATRLTAEWIVERPDINNVISAIANFGSVTLSNCGLEIGNGVGAFGHFESIRFFMYDRTGTQLADVSNYSSDGSSFTVTYLTSQ